MNGPMLLDTGPLVSFLGQEEQHHDWVVSQVSRLEAPFLTCEAVISEACFLMQHDRKGPERVLELLVQGLVLVPFSLAEDVSAVAKLLTRYSNVPMSFADACLVRMAEEFDRSTVFTFDRDFTIYRKNGRQVIPTLMPDR